MLKFVCESCGFAFEVKKANVAKCFNPDCSACGSSDTTEIGRVACELAWILDRATGRGKEVYIKMGIADIGRRRG